MINIIKKDKIGIIPYGSGNIGTLIKTVKNFDKEIILIKDKRDFNKCDKIILPGVGSFGIAIDFLKKKKLIYQKKKYILNGGKTLGICLGMQILYKSSEEAKQVKGLGIINRKIKKIVSNFKFELLCPTLDGIEFLLKSNQEKKLIKLLKIKIFIFLIVLQIKLQRILIVQVLTMVKIFIAQFSNTEILLHLNFIQS